MKPKEIKRDNKLHRRSLRWEGYDYSLPGAYFVTICTYNRECLFGNVVNQKMVLNDTGKTAEMCWREISGHYPDAVVDVYIVMPNHVHGIVMIRCVGANNHLPLRRANNYSPLRKPTHGTSKTIGAIVRGYKIGVTKWMRKNTEVHIVWQRNYYEHVIRGERELNRLREYIINNPMNWAEDRENPMARKQGCCPIAQ